MKRFFEEPMIQVMDINYESVTSGPQIPEGDSSVPTLG